MKYKFIYIVLALLAIQACSEKDLELFPEQSLSDESAFADANAAQGVLFGTYNLLQDLHVFGSQPQIVSDYCTDNVNFVGSFPSLQEFNLYTVAASNSTVTEVWQDTYEAILSSNAIIANVPNIEDPTLTEERANSLIGEAHFIRAICYFLLADIYAQPYQVESGNNLAVPLVTEPFTGEIILYERATLNQIHALIESDLLEAQALLPEVIAQGRASSIAAAALLSRLKLYRNEYAKAIEYADVVMASSKYSMATDFTFYNRLSPEIIFSIENTAIDFENQGDEESGSGSWDDYYVGSTDGGRGDCPFSKDLMNAFEAEAGDRRYDLKEPGKTFSGEDAIFTTKYNDGVNNTSDPALIRYTEIMLNKAEALAELNGVDAEAISLLNMVRSRAGLESRTVADFGSGSALVSAILLERRKELAFEGHRRMDLLRKGLPLRTSSSVPASVKGSPGVNVTAGDPLAIWPVPQAERDVNPNL
ncbi:RagB/SusD family nutrient uptake outer membrane protein [Fulvivirga sediminis]|uniref:RagB/SusD family nutrient uptake outer membrane protein n=1 Tax=Fulvivirga sediminis TaxID=2803949 RepID=A0A937K0X4_9BACT|nr:RagB/SusD family nutrient uptake outer membrane protein [Fulvivirga sediminis]MBL3656052.1 RagB/SusD family nutrient uptake outer membrane protein [Fulvivirga sediminis]